jgi:hypothetical protein
MNDVEFAVRSWADEVNAGSEASDPVPLQVLVSRGRRRRRRRRVGLAATALLGAALVVGATVGMLGAGQSRVQVRTTPTPSSVADRFVPVASTVPGGDKRLLVPFLDGKTVTLSYPADLNIAGLGMNASVEIAWSGTSATTQGCCQPNAFTSYTDMRTQFGATKPITVFSHTPSGEVDLMPGDSFGSPRETFLVFTFGKWLLIVPDAGSLGAHNLSTLAANLSGSVDPTGYLHLSLREPLTAMLHPSIVFGAGTANSPQIEVTPRSCTAGSLEPFQQGDGEHGVAVCDRQGTINASATGPNTFVDGISAGLKLDSTNP